MGGSRTQPTGDHPLLLKSYSRVIIPLCNNIPLFIVFYSLLIQHPTPTYSVGWLSPRRGLLQLFDSLSGPRALPLTFRSNPLKYVYHNALKRTKITCIFLANVCHSLASLQQSCASQKPTWICIVYNDANALPTR